MSSKSVPKMNNQWRQLNQGGVSELFPGPMQDTSKIHTRQGSDEAKDNEIQRKTQNLPLDIIKTFKNLHLKPGLVKGLIDMGFKEPTKTQRTMLPTLLADPPQNIILRAPSNTGNTTAIVLAMLNRIDSSKQYPQVLYLNSTYQLAIQTGQVVTKMAKFCPEIKFKYAFKGEELPRDTIINDHVLIGTPGEMHELMFDMAKIKMVVIDDTNIVHNSAGHQGHSIRLFKCLPSTCQIIFSCQTNNPVVMKFAEIIVPNPNYLFIYNERRRWH